MKYDVAAKEASFNRMQELERKGKEKEEECLHRVSQMESIRLLTQNNNELQVNSVYLVDYNSLFQVQI